MSSTNSCENCGTAFDSTGELTGSKVLCPTCAAERRAQIKAAKSAQAGGTRAPARATTAAAAASPAPAAPPPPRARAAAAPVERPARQRTQGARTRAREQDVDEAGHPHLHGHEIVEADAKRMAKFGWLAVGALTLVTLLVLVFVMNKQNTRQQAIQHHEKELDDIVAHLRAVDLKNESAVNEALAWVNSPEVRKQWKQERIEPDVVNMISTLSATKALIVKTRTLTTKLDDIEAKIAGSPSLDTMSQQFAAVRDPELAQQATEAGGQFKTRFDKASQAVTERYLSSLKTAVTGAATATTRDGLAPYGLYEDALRTVWNEASEAKDAPAIQQYGTALKQVVKEVNELVTTRFDESSISKVPAKNLLDVSGDWLEVKPPSFKSVIGNAGMTLTNEGEGATSGGVSYQPGNHWRDYVLEMELKLDAGELVVYTRIADKMDLKQVPGFSIGTQSGSHIPNLVVEYGKPMSLTISTIGNFIRVATQDNPAAYTDELVGNKSRAGEPGIEAKAGTRATISKLRARVLR